MKKVITFGEIMMRLTTPSQLRFAQTDQWDITFGGGEANVSLTLAQLGIASSHVTKFPDHDIGAMAIQFLRKNQVGVEYITRGGERIGQYFVEQGASLRSTKIVYDRFHSSFSTLSPEEYNWEEILKDAQWFHFTGITPAISESAAHACLMAAQTANKLGITVSADINYRRNLWQYGKTVQEVMPALIECCDLIVCGKGDASDIMGINPLTEKAGFVSVCKQIQEKFPRVKTIINTKRGQESASVNTITGNCWNGTELIKSKTLEVRDIVDRIGGGDAFIAGFIYGKIMEKDDQNALEFAVAASALKHTIVGDANLVTVAEIEEVVRGEAIGRIKR